MYKVQSNAFEVVWILLFISSWILGNCFKGAFLSLVFKRIPKQLFYNQS